jgi:hypothetical protein
MPVPPPPGRIMGGPEGRAAPESMRGCWTGGLSVLVSTQPWTGRTEPEWVAVDSVAAGTASAYPVKGRCARLGLPGSGPPGQWRFDEVLSVLEWEDPHPDAPWRTA